MRDRCKKVLKSIKGSYIHIFTRLGFHKILQKLLVYVMCLIKRKRVHHPAEGTRVSFQIFILHKVHHRLTLQQEHSKRIILVQSISRIYRLPIKCNRNLFLVWMLIKAIQVRKEPKTIHKCNLLLEIKGVGVLGLRKDPTKC